MKLTREGGAALDSSFLLNRTYQEVAHLLGLGQLNFLT